MNFPAPDLTAPSATQAASTLSVTTALAGLAAPARNLTFEFPVGFALTLAGVATTADAGAYATARLKNVATATYYVNNAAVPLPLTVADGDTVRVVITQTSAAAGSYLILSA